MALVPDTKPSQSDGQTAVQRGRTPQLRATVLMLAWDAVVA
jgi:hypothetical protein